MNSLVHTSAAALDPHLRRLAQGRQRRRRGGQHRHPNGDGRKAA